jgi:polyhydroxybutyrate depolymerase
VQGNRWWRALAAGSLILAAGCSGTSSEASDAPVTTATEERPPAGTRPSKGCDGGETAELTSERVDLRVGDVDRYFLVAAPEQDEEPLPLVVDLHGLTEGADIHAAHSGLGDYGREQGFISVFPHGTGEPVRWNIAAGADNPDLEYLDEVLETVGERRCVDLARVYATGLSNGAMMTSLLACERSATFAAVAPVGGITAPEPCDQERALPVLTTHGTADPILLFNGGVGDLSSFLGDSSTAGPGDTTTTTAAPDLEGAGYPETVSVWAQRNGCDNFSDSEAGESVIHRVYDCPRGAEVEFYIVDGGGHTWPGSEFSAGIESITGPTTFEIDWNELAWEFFQRYSLD